MCGLSLVQCSRSLYKLLHDTVTGTLSLTDSVSPGITAKVPSCWPVTCMCFGFLMVQTVWTWLCLARVHRSHACPYGVLLRRASFECVCQTIESRLVG